MRFGALHSSRAGFFCRPSHCCLYAWQLSLLWCDVWFRRSFLERKFGVRTKECSRNRNVREATRSLFWSIPQAHKSQFLQSLQTSHVVGNSVARKREARSRYGSTVPVHESEGVYMQRITMPCLQFRARRNACHRLWTRGAKTHRAARCRFQEESALCVYSCMLISVYAVVYTLTVCVCAYMCAPGSLGEADA
jgi:hypothetical protein